MMHVRMMARRRRKFILPSKPACLHARMGSHASCSRRATMQRQWIGLPGGTMPTKTCHRCRTRPWTRTWRRAGHTLFAFDLSPRRALSARSAAGQAAEHLRCCPQEGPAAVMNLAAARRLGQEGKALLFLKKKKQKDFGPWGSGRAGGSGAQWAKVLWFFLSRKNTLSSRGDAECRGWPVHNGVQRRGCWRTWSARRARPASRSRSTRRARPCWPAAARYGVPRRLIAVPVVAPSMLGPWPSNQVHRLRPSRSVRGLAASTPPWPTHIASTTALA